jgi:hypothetical protein
MEIRNFIEKNKILILAFFCMGTLILISNIFANKSVDGTPENPPQESVDTLIPRGHILIPLELENLEQISSLIGDSGVVDLYTGGSESKKRSLVASRVKVIQAPFNPQVYAALVRETEGAVIQNYMGPFRAVVQNPKQEGSKIQRETQNRFSITYQR